MMKIGVLASTNGSAFKAAWNIIREVDGNKTQFFVLIDRDCGIKQFCEENNISCHKITYNNPDQFSLESANYFNKIGEVSAILFFYSKIVTSSLFLKFPCINMHPSLLPSFKGLDGVKLFLASNAKFLGASLHLVDEGIDTGEIIAQVSTPIDHIDRESSAYKISYLQKIYLMLVFHQILRNNSIEFSNNLTTFKWNNQLPFNHFANPSLENTRMLDLFKTTQTLENTFI